MSITPTLEPIDVLDIGCGTGLELAAFFAKAPNAHVECIDLSAKLTAQLREKYSRYVVTTHLASYLTYPYPHVRYRYILASSTLHHLLDDEKRRLFIRLRDALAVGGLLIIGDYYVSPEEALQRQCEYDALIAAGFDLHNGKYHFDVPTSADREQALLQAAGFTTVRTVWQSANYAVITAGMSSNP